MNFVWTFEDVQIPSVSMNRWADTQLWTSGICFYRGRPLQWEASALQGGWYIIITAPHGKLGEVQGATFNLPLEIAAAVRRLA